MLVTWSFEFERVNKCKVLHLVGITLCSLLNVTRYILEEHDTSIFRFVV
jgi:hypothetical protein